MVGPDTWTRCRSTHRPLTLKGLDCVSNGRYRYICRYLVRFWYGQSAGLWQDARIRTRTPVPPLTTITCPESFPQVHVLLANAETCTPWFRPALAPAQNDPHELPHHRRVIQSLFHRGVRQIEPLLQEIHTQHTFHSHRWPPFPAFG